MYTGKVEPDPDAIRLAQAWVLGDKLGCLPFSDKALLELFDFHQGFPLKPEIIQFAYENSVAGSKLRKWALDEFLFSTIVDFCDILDDSAFRALTEIDDWGRDLTRALVTLRSDRPVRPYENPSLYMQVLDGDSAKSLQRQKASNSCNCGGASSSRSSTDIVSTRRSRSSSGVGGRSRSTSRDGGRWGSGPTGRW